MRHLRAADAARLALLTGAGGFALAVLSGLLAALGASAPVAVLVRAVLVTALLVLAVRLCLGGRPTASRVPSALAGLLAGALLDVAWVSGAAYLTRAFTQSLPLCVVVDLLVWLAVGLAALRVTPAVADVPLGYR